MSPNTISSTLFILLVVAAQLSYLYLVGQLLRTFFS